MSRLNLSLDQVDALRAFDAGAVDAAEITADVAERYREEMREWKLKASISEQLQFVLESSTLYRSVSDLGEFVEWFEGL